MHTAKLPFRMSEGNSCWNGGQAGVSDVFASALWAADTLLHFATLGWSGANLHGGGNGIYSPIVGSPSSGFSRRPEYFGMQFAQRFASATFLHTVVESSSERVTAYAGRTHQAGHGADLFAIVNKSGSPAGVQVRGLPRSRHPWRSFRLSAPSLDARSEVTFAEGPPIALEHAFTLPAYTATLFAASSR